LLISKIEKLHNERDSAIRQMEGMGMVILNAAARGDAVTVRALLSSTAGALSLINTQDESGETPLYVAAENGHEAVTKLLIAARCNVDLQANNGATPLYIAAHSGQASVSKQLIEACCNVDLQMHDGRTPLFIAAQGGHKFIVAENGHASVTKHLIEARCNINLHEEGGCTHPLHEGQCYSDLQSAAW
jgi:ankyrin repeat protein